MFIWGIWVCAIREQRIDECGLAGRRRPQEWRYAMASHAMAKVFRINTTMKTTMATALSICFMPSYP